MSQKKYNYSQFSRIAVSVPNIQKTTTPDKKSPEIKYADWAKLENYDSLKWVLFEKRHEHGFI